MKSSGMMERFCRLTGDSKKLEGEEGCLTDRGGGSMKVSRSLGDPMKKLWLRQQIVFFPRWVHMFTNPIQVQQPS